MRALLDFTQRIPGFLTLSIAFTACHSGGRTVTAGVVLPAPAVAADSCAVVPPSPEPPKTFRILVTDGLVTGSPGDARSRGERIIARQLYETLVRVTCAGRVEPALAESWTSADSGRIWTFQIRSSSRFWDGTPVMASQVLATWAGGRTADAQVPWAGIEHARIVDEKKVAVFFRQASREVPRVLADPRLAITLPVRNQRPQGTGLYRPSYEDSVSLIADGWDSGVSRPKSLPASLEYHAASGKAARDVVDNGIDLLVTDDKSLLDYAAARGQSTTLPLPWDRRYVLFVPATAGGDPPAQGPGAGFLDPVAREAVAVDARVAERSDAWQLDSCGSGLGTDPDVRRQPRRVVYPSFDETARELAHRLVTFAGVPGQGGDWLAAAFHTPPGPKTRAFPLAIGLEPAAWPRALERGDEVAYVFALPARGFGLCSPPSRSQGSWIPLIDTRPHLVLRNGLGGVSVDWSGTPFLGGAR